jgi:hypothetical protein
MNEIGAYWELVPADEFPQPEVGLAAVILITVTGPSGQEIDCAKAGLCAGCRHSRPIESDRGSVFLRCELSLTDPRFPKYPRLPVLVCAGYEPKPSGQQSLG